MSEKLIDDWVAVVDKEWERTKPPLEKFYDKWSDRWEPGSPYRKYAVILANGDLTIDGVVTLAGDPIACPLCGREDHWIIEGKVTGKETDPETGEEITVVEITVFVCEHLPKDLPKLGLLHWIPCRVVATIPARLVREFWEVP